MDSPSIKLDEETINIIQESTSIIEENTSDKFPDLPLSKDRIRKSLVTSLYVQSLGLFQYGSMIQ
jgi:hypothetical protein